MAPATSMLYPSDLSDREWAILAPLLPPPKPGGRPRRVDLRVILNGIFHVLRSGCQWRLLPHEYGPWSTVYGYFRAWRGLAGMGRGNASTPRCANGCARRLDGSPRPVPPFWIASRSRPPSAAARMATTEPRSSPGANAICSSIPSAWSSGRWCIRPTFRTALALHCCCAAGVCPAAAGADLGG